MKLHKAQPGQVNYHLIDRFTLVHFLIGVFYGWIHLNFYVMFFLAVFWEVIENPLKKHATFIFPHATADTWQNILGDVVAVVLGWYLFVYFYTDKIL